MHTHCTYDQSTPSGREVGNTILWSQPEVAVYDRFYHGGTSAGGYPDFLFTYANGSRSEGGICAF